MKSYRVVVDVEVEAEDLATAFRWLDRLLDDLASGRPHQPMHRGVIRVDEDGVRVWEEGSEPR